MLFNTAYVFAIVSAVATSVSAYPVSASGNSLEARYDGQPCVTSAVCGHGEECVRHAGQLYGECHAADEGYASSHHLANHAKPAKAPKHKRDLARSENIFEARYDGQPCVTSAVCGHGEECVRNAGQLYGECHAADEGYASSHHLANHAKPGKAPKHKRDVAPSRNVLEARYEGQPCVTSAVCGHGEECVRHAGQLYGECHAADEGYASSHHLANHAKAAKAPKHKLTLILVNACA
ncbi:hypothetical protein B0H34DRAFT_810179 [Crassisporium funariophilum]|nr:hypothetical protein B0H34DRAFT_810179 [Crassisporium funariophilum]